MEAANLSAATSRVAFSLGPETCCGNPRPGGLVGSTPEGTALPGWDLPFSVFTVLMVTLLVLLILAPSPWNLLALVTILRVRAFHRVPHNLVAPTAVSDQLVAALVMPLSLVSDLSAGRRWQLGRKESVPRVDLLRRAVLHSEHLGRGGHRAGPLQSVTRHPRYTPRTRPGRRALLMALTWAPAALIALAPLLFAWGEAYDVRRQRCKVSQEPSYAFTTCGAIYLPLGVLFYLFFFFNFLCSKSKEGPHEAEMVFTPRCQANVSFQSSRDSWREEKRAAMMGGPWLALCWIPFFLADIFLWLGYSNSFFNPLIYTAFNKNYNNAFKSLFTK
uniref:Uncharacterized protein n=1 Tax=Jaculus jaculus TaxID=51337 RepID=A0A8C5P208_JACJA